MRRLSLLLLIIFLSPLANASPLTDRDITQWANSFKAVQNWADKTDLKTKPLKKPRGKDDYGQQIGAMLKRTQDHPKYAELEALLKQHGYSSADAWANTGDRILSAYIANQLEDYQPEIEKGLAQARENMKHSNMPPEQKAMVEKMMREAAAQTSASVNAPEADKKVVDRNSDTLKRLFDDLDKQ